MSKRLDIETVLSEYAPFLARIAATHEANVSLQQDLLQDISLAVWRALESYRADASVKTFIARIAHNRCIDHVLKEQRRNANLHQDMSIEDIHNGEPNELSQQTTTDQKIDLATALQKLPLGLRQVITMQLEGFNQAEIGEILGINENSIAKRASRARQQLAQLLGNKNG